MSSSVVEVLLNRFPIKKLNTQEKTVYVYNYTLNPSPEPGKEFSAVSKILWKIGTPAATLASTIVTKEEISQERLQGEGWKLYFQGIRALNGQNQQEREALERLERRWLEKNLKQRSDKNRVERCGNSGFIWWNADKVILKKPGWEVHTGVYIDVSVHHSDALFLEIDIHHRFYTPWTLSQWFNHYPDIAIDWVRNTYDEQSWRYSRVSNENPENLLISNTSLADYHRNHKKAATESEIRNSRVVYVWNTQGKELAHLSGRLKPSVTMEILSELANRGQKEAEDVFKQVRKSSQERFDESTKVAQWLTKKIYQIQARQIKSQKAQGISLRQNSPILLVKSTKVYKSEASLRNGCLRVGEKQFGFLDLVGNGAESETQIITNKLKDIAKKSDTEIIVELPKHKTELPDSLLTRRQFWQDWANQGTQTILVVTNWLETHEKTKLRREALEANIALQFMLPMPKLDSYRLVNIMLGLLVKAKWQPVGLEPLDNEYAADLVIGFDAGTNRNLYYGTSAFAILANGQSIGWEIPEAQPGERLSGKAVLRTVANLIGRFQRIENRLPKRLLLLRDGFVQSNEFEETIAALKEENIAVDLLEIRKSGGGRMAVNRQTSKIIDAPPGTAVLSQDGNTILIVTSVAKAGGSARPLQIVRYAGDAPQEILAKQIDRLSMLHPASGFSSSRLPMVIHYADKMAKEVQRLGQVGLLQGLDREKIFFV